MVQTRHASGAMTILKKFGLEDLVDNLLAANGVHCLGNLLSMDSHCHSEFDNLNLWFERTATVRHFFNFLATLT